MLTDDQKNRLKAGGYSDAKIAAYEQQKFGSQTDSTNGKNLVTSTVETLGGPLKSGVDKFANGIGDVTKSIYNSVTGNATDQNTTNAISGGLKTVAGAIEIAASPFSTLMGIVGKIPVGGGKNLGDIANMPIDAAGNAIGGLKPLQDFVTKYPNVVEDIPNLITSLTGLLGLKNSSEIKGAINNGLDTAGNAIDTTVNTAKNIKNTVVDSTTALKEKIAPTPTTDQIIGQVAQGDIKDVPSFKSGLESVDTSKVKTYADLNKVSNEKIGELAKQQDELLGQDKTPRKVQQLATEVKSGNKTTLHNYVIDAVKQLKDYYIKTNNVSELAKIKEYETKLNVTKGEGLTLKEINDIARMHGKDLNGFNANGELASGLTKQSAENTRTGLKKTVRNLLPDGTRQVSETLDTNISDLYTVKNLSADMAEKVNTLTQRLQKPNILQKLGSIVGRAARVTGVGDIAQKVLGIEKVPGASTLNPVELEAKLSKNLERINAALKKDDAGFLKDITEIMQEN